MQSVGARRVGCVLELMLPKSPRLWAVTNRPNSRRIRLRLTRDRPFRFEAIDLIKFGQALEDLFQRIRAQVSNLQQFVLAARIQVFQQDDFELRFFQQSNRAL